ncbi:MAG: hypothetical protein LBS97_06050 [Treponema sp.]|jgi:hypothetical protein|nr:hypothetical protein [Treponema sp.]
MALFKSEKVKATVWEKLGDYSLDISKMVFAGSILVTIVDADLPHVLVIVGGAGVTALAFCLGVFFISRNEKE